ncbi:MAG TPA: right-handed parallel beta-helix repeat-containing protein, partial [Verrucomicrobium sp.]|nr:right-handed parallel beta-helix repeat-containing protein [Verrucomicrobium sp.]
FTVTDCSILDCDNIGLWLKDCTRSKVSDCLVRDDRQHDARKATLSLLVEGGKDNWIKGSVFSNGVKADDGVGVLEGNR